MNTGRRGSCDRKRRIDIGGVQHSVATFCQRKGKLKIHQ